MVAEAVPGQLSATRVVPGRATLDGIDADPQRRREVFRPTADGDADRSTRRAADFAGALAEIVITMRRVGIQDEARALGVLTEGAVTALPGVEQSAVVVAGTGGLTVSAVHGALPSGVVALHHQLGDGPCLDAVTRTVPVLVPDVRADPRWPTFARFAGECAVGSLLCTPLAVQSADHGSLMLLATAPHAFDEQAQAMAAVFAAHVTLALVGLREVRQLTAMAQGRDAIGQAKGILMERHRMNADDAFALLVQASQRANLKVREVSRQLIATGSLPG